MENRDILIDTSILIDFLRKQNKKNTCLWKIKEEDSNCIVSTITVFELYAGAVTETHKKDLIKLFKWMDVVPFTKEMAIQSGYIYRALKLQNQLIEFRDIFIGATAIELSIPLLTFNDKHFARIKGINIKTTNI